MCSKNENENVCWYDEYAAFIIESCLAQRYSFASSHIHFGILLTSIHLVHKFFNDCTKSLVITCGGVPLAIVDSLPYSWTCGVLRQYTYLPRVVTFHLLGGSMNAVSFNHFLLIDRGENMGDDCFRHLCYRSTMQRKDFLRRPATTWIGVMRRKKTSTKIVSAWQNFLRKRGKIQLSSLRGNMDKNISKCWGVFVSTRSRIVSHSCRVVGVWRGAAHRVARVRRGSKIRWKSSKVSLTLTGRGS